MEDDSKQREQMGVNHWKKKKNPTMCMCNLKIKNKIKGLLQNKN